MNAKRARRAVLIALFMVLAAFLVSCVSSDEVAAFASNAAKALDQGTAIWDDIPASVLRRLCDANMAKLEFDFKPDTEVCISNAIEKDDFETARKERDDLVAVQKVLIDYFTAINQLAAFGKTSDSDTKSKDDAAQAGKAATGLAKGKQLTSGDEANAITGLAGIMVNMFSAGYKVRHLTREVEEGDKAVAVIADALKRIVKTDYMFDPQYLSAPDKTGPASLLDLEANRMRREYRDTNEGELVLRISWTDQVAKLSARNCAAKSYVDALQKIKLGHHELAKHANQLRARDLALTLEPYTTSLEGLISNVQKVF